MTRVYRLGARMMSRETRYGLDAGGVYTIEEIREVRTVSGNVITVITVTVQVGQRLVEVHDPDRVLVPAHIDAYGVRGRQRRAWRATFADAGELEAWCKLNEATVRGQRFVGASEPDQE